MPVLTQLKTATTRAELAELLGFKSSSLAFILFKLPPASKYTTFDIAKRNGGTRTIKAPAKSLKLLQRRLSDLLQDCVDEINLTTMREDRAAHGFKRKRSIVTNASLGVSVPRWPRDQCSQQNQDNQVATNGWLARRAWP